MPCLVLPATSPLIALDPEDGHTLSDEALFWCAESLTGSLRLIVEAETATLVFEGLSDLLSFKRRWL